MTPRKQFFTITDSIEYKEDVLPKLVEEYKVRVRDLVLLMGYTQDAKAQRLISKRTMPNVKNLTQFCHGLNWNLLQMFRYNEHDFETDIEDLYRLEMTGIKVSTLLKDLGITPVDRHKLPQSHEDNNHIKTIRDLEIRRAKHKKLYVIGDEAMLIEKDGKEATELTGIRITQLEIENQKLKEELRQKETEFNKTVLYLSRKLREAEEKALSYTEARMVADDSKIGER